jgi:sugar/nucleoside kinase (ribokinase family)
MKTIDVVAIGTCYVDINATNYPFADDGIAVEHELVGTNYETIAGGSAVNFCRLLQAQGLTAALMGMAGADAMGDLLATLLHKDGIKSELLQRALLQTNVSFNMTNPTGQHIMCVAGTANVALAPDDVLLALDKLMPAARMLYMGSCFKLQSLAVGFPQMSENAFRHKAALVIDHGRLPAQLSLTMRSAVRVLVLGATYYLPSKDEFCSLWEVDTIAEGLQLLAQQAPQLQVVVKDGANGAHYWHDGQPQHCPALPIATVANATGAGDSFNAGFMYARLHNGSMPQSVAHGCAVAAAALTGQPIPQFATPAV